MSVEQRIQTCILLEKMRVQKDYSRRLGLEDVSTIHGRQIDKNVRGVTKKG